MFFVKENLIHFSDYNKFLIYFTQFDMIYG